jgi:hypothetical protein
MKKHQFLTPLAVSVAALAGAPALPVQAATSAVTAGQQASLPAAGDRFVLTRNVGGELKFADHESHASHASHSSHASGS